MIAGLIGIFLMCFASFCAFSGVLLGGRADRTAQGAFGTAILGYLAAFIFALIARADIAALVAAGGTAFCLYSLAKERKQ